MSNNKIKIVNNGPYIVSGNVPLFEKIIVPDGKQYEFEMGRELPQAEAYALCRCGKTKNAPFCDGTHETIGFLGTETASKDKYEDRAELQEGYGIDLLDDNRCAYARFCHREIGNVWRLTDNSENEECRQQAIRAASDCPSGRLTAVDKDGEIIEPIYEPSISIIRDPENGVCAGIYVRGYIPIESSDGSTYELRNRVALCRCGKSKNKPFCDATHVMINFSDGSVR